MTNPTWHPLHGYGFESLDLHRWSWRCAQMLLGLTTDQDTGIQWGNDVDQISTGVFKVRKDSDWTPTAERLEKDLRELRQIRKSKSKVSDHLDIDVFNWMGWLLSRAEEYGGAVDSHGRFLRDTSIASLAGCDHEPILDEMVATVRQVFVSYCESINVRVQKHSPWPLGKRAAVWISHDVDHAEPRSLPVAFRKAIGAILTDDPAVRSRRWKDAVNLLRRPAINPYWQMDDFSRISLAAGSPSTYFVLPHTSRMVSEGGRRVRRYDVRQHSVVQLMHRLSDAGFELGLHVTYDAHDYSQGLKSDLETFEACAPPNYGSRGARCHYLRFTVPDTWRREEAAGLYYDSSLGWSSDWGFRSGSSLPYHPFDRELSRQFNLWELEVNLMDVAVGASEFLTAAQRLVSAARMFGGCAGILLHPTPWDGRTGAEHLDIHRALLADLAAEDVWLAAPSTIIEAMEHYEEAVTSPTTRDHSG